MTRNKETFAEWLALPKNMRQPKTQKELALRLNCASDPAYFIDSFCWIEDKVCREWVPFNLWDSQLAAIRRIASARKLVILKARQLSLTWLIVCYALWTMLFRQGSGVLIFSRRETEASELLQRMRGVHQRLPLDLRAEITVDNTSELAMEHIGSWARCFPTTKHSGRSYSATVAVVDEAGFLPDLKALLNAVKPTIDGGGKLILVSTANKENCDSEYKRIWGGAVKGLNGYRHIFLPWDAHPNRDQAWYAQQGVDYELDDLYQEYPATPEQAFSPRRSSKRFLPEGGHDDLAMAFINALVGLRWQTYSGQQGEGISVVLSYPDIVENLAF